MRLAIAISASVLVLWLFIAWLLSADADDWKEELFGSAVVILLVAIFVGALYGLGSLWAWAL